MRTTLNDYFAIVSTDKDLHLLRQSTSSQEGHGTGMEIRRGSLPGSTGRHNSPNRLVIEEEPAFRYMGYKILVLKHVKCDMGHKFCISKFSWQPLQII